MPVLIGLSVLLAIRVLTLGAPDPSHPEHHVWNGMGFLWNPDLSRLTDAKVWLAAAGQIFFTLSVGFGTIQVYASYLRSRDDVVVTGLSTTMVNEWGEVILGSTIAIPIAYAFFGPQGTVEVAQGGAFNLGFATMPVVLQQLPWGVAFGTAWFFLLFIAGTLSQLALMQPLITFLQDELRWSHRKAVLVTSTVVFLAAHVPILGSRAAHWMRSIFGPAPSGLRCLPLWKRSSSSGSSNRSRPGKKSTEGRRSGFPGSSCGCSRMSRRSICWCYFGRVDHSIQSGRVGHGGRPARRCALEMGGKALTPGLFRHHVLRRAQSLQAGAAQGGDMTPLGWLFLTVSWAVLTSLRSGASSRFLTPPLRRKNHLRTRVPTRGRTPTDGMMWLREPFPDMRSTSRCRGRGPGLRSIPLASPHQRVTSTV